jgi:hypothetical protein
MSKENSNRPDSGPIKPPAEREAISTALPGKADSTTKAEAKAAVAESRTAAPAREDAKEISAAVSAAETSGAKVARADDDGIAQDTPSPSVPLNPQTVENDQFKQMNKAMAEAQAAAAEVNKNLRGPGPDPVPVKRPAEADYSDSAKPLKLETPLYDIVAEARELNKGLMAKMRAEGRDHYTARLILKQAARQLGVDWVRSEPNQIDYSERMPHNQPDKVA